MYALLKCGQLQKATMTTTTMTFKRVKLDAAKEYNEEHKRRVVRNHQKFVHVDSTILAPSSPSSTNVKLRYVLLKFVVWSH